MKILKIFTMMVVLTVGALAQERLNDSRNAKTEPLVVKTISAESSTYRNFIATFYSLTGIMSNGDRVHSGAIAADTRILPLGTVVHIEGMGTFTVKDTGSAIKGAIVDIWVSSKAQALRMGRKKIRLRVISYGRPASKKKNR